MAQAPKVTMYSTRFCPFCVMARRLLDKKGVCYEEVRRHTVPQIFVGERHIGGYEDLCALDCAGQLDALLAPR
jgi:glutaredoxin 3